MQRSVRGSLFSDYIRMIRRQKDVDWATVLCPEDLGFVRQKIDDNGWYPMATFERLGVAILKHVRGATMESVRLWGRYSATQVGAAHPELVAPNDCVESLMRLRVMRGTLFDFPAFDIPMLIEQHAQIAVNYYMGPLAEEAACTQTMGFCEGVLSLAGARDIAAKFTACAWTGDGQTLIDLSWDDSVLVF